MQSIIDSKQILFVCIDVQEKLLEHMAHKEKLIKNTNILLESSKELCIPTLITEQYPNGLGNTHKAIKPTSHAHILEKTHFGIFAQSSIASYIAQSNTKILVFFGIESHICVLQSVIEARNLGYECLLVADACSSRDRQNHKLAMSFLQNQGTAILPTESILFRIIGDSKHSSFKTISSLIK